MAGGKSPTAPDRRLIKITPRNKIEQEIYEECAQAHRNLLVDDCGEPADYIVDGSGVNRLAVDAAVSVNVDADIGSNLSISRHQNPFNYTDEIDLLPAGLDTTSYTQLFSVVSASDDLRFRVVKVKADTFGTFRVKLDGDIIEYYDTSPIERNCRFHFLEDLDVPSGSTVTVEFRPERIRTLSNYNFWMKIEGYEDTTP